MWDDVVIGEPAQKICSAVIVTLREPVPRGFTVSENQQAFWITNVYLDIGMTVYKNTEIGEQLAQEIAAGTSGGYIRRWLLQHLLPRVAPFMMQQRLTAALESARRDGRQDKADEIRRVLGGD